MPDPAQAAAPVDAPGARKPRPELLAPYAATCGGLQRLQRRMDALDARCTRNFDALWARLNSLPAAAGFEPFAAVAVPGAGDAAQGQPTAQVGQRRAGARRPLPAAGPQTSALSRAAQAAVEAAVPASPQEALGAVARAAGAVAAKLTAAVTPRRTTGMADSIGAALGGRGFSAAAAAAATEPALQGKDAVAAAVGQLMRTFAPGLAPAADLAGRAVTLDAGRWIAEALAASPKPAAQPAAARNRPAARADDVAKALAEAARQGVSRVLGIADAVAPSMGDKLVAGGVAQAVLGGLQRQPAQRASSRLTLPGAVASPPNNSNAAAAAAPAGAAEGDGQDVLSTLNQLLLDQAWLRGVDLR